uniref:Uncharacterized protein n=1 Tax=Cajanus cajan TaxID=3821 RepID=A0A151SFM7_CAJCA|nr:hypothetical protein KK1_024488 [Cajanus cajan]
MDGAFFGVNGEVVCSGVIQDHKGQFIYACPSKCSCSIVIGVEIQAIWIGL